MCWKCVLRSILIYWKLSKDLVMMKFTESERLEVEVGNAVLQINYYYYYYYYYYY